VAVDPPTSTRTTPRSRPSYEPPARPAGDPQRTDTTLQHIQTFLGRHTADEARAHYETFIAPYFTTDGQADLTVGATAITTVAAELGVPATITAAEFYRTTTTIGHRCA
jgi:hypothetical protein